MSDNAVLRLREQRLAKSTRPFLARGSRAIRCQSCLLPKRNCICAAREIHQAASCFCLVMYDTEPMKPSNTGRLIADVLPDTQAFMWSRTQTNPALFEAISDPSRQPYVVFPASFVQPPRQVFTEVPSGSKPPLFVMLDGTWNEARKMFRKSPYLDNLPVFSLDVSARSRYILREASRPEFHCTAEVAVVLLEKAGDLEASAGLSRHFTHFRTQYLAGKPHNPMHQFTAKENETL
ncbi:MAG: tRNA-uridine aminocarboxypropyltransferase [Ewingella sp.]